MGSNPTGSIFELVNVIAVMKNILSIYIAMMAEWSKATVLRSVLFRRRGFEPHSWYNFVSKFIRNIIPACDTSVSQYCIVGHHGRVVKAVD